MGIDQSRLIEVLDRANENLLKENEELREKIKFTENEWKMANKVCRNRENQLREIDTHIRSTKNPVPYIIETLKKSLPEYK